MNIISLGPAYPYRGGLASFNDRLAQQFTEEGHKIEILTFRLQYPGILFPGKTQYTDGSAAGRDKDHQKDEFDKPVKLDFYRTRDQKSKAGYSADKVLAAIYGSMPWNYSQDSKVKQAYCCHLYI